MIKIMIPARLNSRRLPGKVLADIKGKPVIQHVWERCNQSGLQYDLLKGNEVDSEVEVMILADSERVIKICKEFGATVHDTRAWTIHNGTERCAIMADALNVENYERIINVQGDNWNVEPAAILEILENMKTVLPYERPRTMFALREKCEDEKQYFDQSKVKVIVDKDDNAIFFKRDEYHPEYFDMHCGIYGYFVPFLQQYMHWNYKKDGLENMESLEQMRVIENGGRVYCPLLKTCKTSGDSINTEEDLIKANRG